MILKNPTKETVSIVFNGHKHSIAPGAELDVNNDLGVYWVSVHEFLQVVSKEAAEAKKVEKEETKETKKPAPKKSNKK